MTFAALHAYAALPEILISAAACVILLLGRFVSGERGQTWCWRLSLAALLGAAALALNDFAKPDLLAFNGLFVRDGLATLLKTCLCLLAAAALIYGRAYNRLRGLWRDEYAVLGLFCVVGMLVMAAAGNLLTLYLGLELMSLCLYAMIAFQRDGRFVTEAAMKYFVLGALASSLLLYGMSLLYGLSGSLALAEIGSAVGQLPHNSAGLNLAVVFIVVGLAFKLGLVPFHMWLPDVYHGAPTSTTAFLSAAPKLASCALLLRLLLEGLGDLHALWQGMLAILAVLSVAIGNFGALAQSRIKRLLAYSTIAHMGFFLFGLLSATPEGYGAALFYMLVYSVMSLAAFALILELSTDDHEPEHIDDLKGLAARQPLLAGLLLVLMLSMAGIPPTLGFFAKLAVIQAVLEAGLPGIAVIAVLLAVVGAFYYLRLIRLCYFERAPEGAAAVPAGGVERWLLSVHIISLLAIVPWLGGLLAWCVSVMR